MISSFIFSGSNPSKRPSPQGLQSPCEVVDVKIDVAVHETVEVRPEMKDLSP